MTRSDRSPLIDEDGEVREITQDDLRYARRPGRPPLPAPERKCKISIMLDPDVLDRLKAGGRGWQTRANAILRKGVGL